jgi:hypothetical protein
MCKNFEKKRSSYEKSRNEVHVEENHIRNKFDLKKESYF